MKNKILSLFVMLACFCSVSAQQVTVNQVVGWYESAFVTWELYSGADMYNVYVKEASASSWTKLDSELIRNYGYYGRADAVGLKAGNYQFKIEATKSGSVISGSDVQTASFAVKAYDRAGFAHKDGVAVGAYNNDGTLKANARVIYVDNSNVDQISLPVLNGSVETTCVGLGEIFKAYEKGLETRPLSVRVIGNITMTSSQLYGDQDAMQLKGKNNTIPMYVTIEGIGNDACFSDWGFVFVKANNVELRNVGLKMFNDDGISIKGSYKMWIHHCDVFYGKKGSAADQAKGDGSLDVKDDSQYCTFSYNHFWDSGKMSLCGMKSETGPNYMTYHHNWFDHSDSRHPRVRTMTVHVYNNYYDGVAKYGVGITTGSSTFVESNFFRDTNRPMMASRQGTDATGDGTFSSETGGIIKSYGNVFVECGSNFSYITANEVAGSGATSVNATSFDAYHATSRDEQVPSSVTALVGGTSYDNFDTDPSLMYTYTPDAAIDVPAKVKSQAGRMLGGDFTWVGFDNAVDDHDYNVNAAMKNAIDSYQTALVEIAAFTKTVVEPMSYTATYYADVEGTQIFAVMTDQVSVIYPEGVPSMEGYTFTGWSAIQGARLSSNIEIYPSFSDGKNSTSGSTSGGTTEVNKWNFTNWSAETQAAVRANTSVWTRATDDTDRYDSQTFSTATDLGFAETEGLTFEGKVRISWDSSKGQYLQGSFTINVPVEEGQKVTVNFSNTGSSNGTRYLVIDGENVASSGNTTKVDATYEVPAGKTSIAVKCVDGTGAAASFNYYTITVTEEVGEKEKPVFMYNITSATVDMASESNEYPELENSSNGTVTYTSSNPSVATVSETGVVTPLSLGVTIIRAVVAETETYAAASAQYELVVTDSSIPTYTVTFMADGSVYEVKENQTVVVYPATSPAKEGYDFAGWDVAAGTVLTTDLTVNATWTEIPTYTVTYVVDGDVYAVMENQTVVVYPATPYKDGYVFRGWDVAAGTVLTADLTVSGTFAVAVAETVTLQAGSFPDGYTLDGATSGTAYTYSDDTKNAMLMTLAAGQHTVVVPAGMKVTSVVFEGCAQNNADTKANLTEFNGESCSIAFKGRKTLPYVQASFEGLEIVGSFTFTFDYNVGVKLMLSVEPASAVGGMKTEADGAIRYNGREAVAAGTIMVYDVRGCLVLRGRDSVDLSNLVHGVYIVRCENSVLKVCR